MLSTWVKSWKGTRKEFSIEEWERLCKELNQKLNLRFDLCRAVRVELDLGQERVVLAVKIDRMNNKVTVRVI